MACVLPNASKIQCELFLEYYDGLWNTLLGSQTYLICFVAFNIHASTVCDANVKLSIVGNDLKQSNIPMYKRVNIRKGYVLPFLLLTKIDKYSRRDVVIQVSTTLYTTTFILACMTVSCNHESSSQTAPDM